MADLWAKIVPLEEEADRKVRELFEDIEREVSNYRGAEAIDRARYVAQERLPAVVLTLVGDAFRIGYETIPERTIMGEEQREAVKFLLKYGFGQVTGITDEFASELRKAILKGVTLGLSANQTQNELLRVIKVSRGRAESIARTELIRAWNMGNLESMRIDDVTYKRWIAALLQYPEVTCRGCYSLHGVEILREDLFIDAERQRRVITPPLHPRCRCTMAGYD